MDEGDQMKVIDLNIIKDDFTKLFDSISKEIDRINKSKGFHKKWNNAEKIALMHSELSEALEATRKTVLQRDEHCESFLNLEVELADCIIRIMHFGYKNKLRVADALIAKVQYNNTRPYMHEKKF